MNNLEDFGGMQAESNIPYPPNNGIQSMQMNFQGSETTWILCQQELSDCNL